MHTIKIQSNEISLANESIIFWSDSRHNNKTSSDEQEHRLDSEMWRREQRSPHNWIKAHN